VNGGRRKKRWSCLADRNRVSCVEKNVLLGGGAKSMTRGHLLPQRDRGPDRVLRGGEGGIQKEWEFSEEDLGGRGDLKGIT